LAQLVRKAQSVHKALRDLLANQVNKVLLERMDQLVQLAHKV
jgi:hypothetical protein